MISHRHAASLGVSELGWIRARHHFCFAGAQNVDLVNWGALRAVNHNILVPNAATTPVTHYGTEVIHIVESGAIDFVRLNGEATRVRSGQILSTYAGSGLHFSIANALDVDAAYTEIWLTCEAPHAPAVVRRLRQSRPQETQVIAGMRDTGLYRLHCAATMTKHHIPNGLSADIPITAASAYAFLLKGAVTHDGTGLAPYEGIAIDGETRLVVSGKDDAELMLIEMPA